MRGDDDVVPDRPGGRTGSGFSQRLKPRGNAGGLLFARIKPVIEFVGAEAAATVRALMLAAFDEYRTVLVVPSSALDETVEDVAEHLRQGGGVLARIDGRAIGSGRYEWREDHVYIGRLSVLPEARGSGIGAAMMEAIHELARTRGVGEARIGVRTMLPKNIALYERLGYVVTATYKHPRGEEIIGHGEAALNQAPPAVTTSANCWR